MIYLSRTRQVILESLTQGNKTVKEIAGGKHHTTVIAPNCFKMRKLGLIVISKIAKDGTKTYQISEAGKALLRGEYLDTKFERLSESEFI